ncbi:metal dependent phosphohydrolase [Chitinispirillum alkaliphilum]|nr:metal dependent phosphohydrolase [Chitinispirillum alkaliphilum]
MKQRKVPGILGSENKGPLVLMFSCRDKVREILSVGLVQSNYRIIQAATSSLAIIKSTQMLPALVIADLAGENPSDISLALRLRRSSRTQKISILVILPQNPHSYVLKTMAELTPRDSEDGEGIDSLGYPFSYAKFLEKVKELAPPLNVKQDPERVSLPTTNRGVAKRLFDSSSTVSKKLSDIDSLILKQWVFPFTVVRAFDIMETDKSCFMELSRCISGDLAVSSAVLKVVNTVFYASRNGRITNINNAVVRLGFRETRNIMACLSLIDLTPGIHGKSGFERKEFWLHSLAVALIAEKLCDDCRFVKPGYAFISGLLHDLGKIPLDNCFEDVFPYLLDETISSFESFAATEERLMDFNHAELGQYLANKWNFPHIISQSILNHHNKDRILKNPGKAERMVLGAVFAANLLAKAMGIGHSCDEILEEIPLELLQDLNFKNGPDETFLFKIRKDVELFCQFMNLPFNNDNNLRETDSGKKFSVFVHYNNKVQYHPVVTALRCNGFEVKASERMSEKMSADVIISMPEKGLPPEMMLYEDEFSKSEKTLRVILVPFESVSKLNIDDISDNNMLIMNRNNLDTRLLIHALDTFFQKCRH